MRCVSEDMIKTLEDIYGEDFVLGIESSANEHGAYGGMDTFINLYSNKVSDSETCTIDGIDIYAYPMPVAHVEVDYGHVLTKESIFLLCIFRDEFISGIEWDMLTEISEYWGVEGTQKVLNKLPKELYDLNAKDFIEYFDSESYGS